MTWLEITIDTPGGSCQAAAAALTARGFSDLVIEDQQELETFLEENRAYWDYIDEALEQRLRGLSRIKLYLPQEDPQALARLEQAVSDLGLTYAAAPLAQTDWDESWKENYPPQEVGNSLVILPYWLADQQTTRRKIILDPGLTFGTGAHPSTRLVLRAMETAVTPRTRCLDLGSGSGILSIAALRLGAASATGVDIDPKAEDAARENAAYNGFGPPEFTALTGNVTQDKALMAALAPEGYQLVLVNIVADVIVALAPALPALLSQDGALICSGILDTRLGDVTAALERTGLTLTSVTAEEDWRCVTARKSSPTLGKE